jgi:hypothetical protein
VVIVFWRTTETFKSSWIVLHHLQKQKEYYNSAIQKHPTRQAWYFNSMNVFIAAQRFQNYCAIILRREKIFFCNLDEIRTHIPSRALRL